jgi:putative transcriptional regulator
MYTVLYNINGSKCMGWFLMYMKNRVKELRAKYNFTQEALAETVHVTRQTIVALEKGSYIPSLLLAMNIARTFKLPIEEIFFMEGDE